MPRQADFSRAIAALGLECLPIVEADAVRAASLPLHHRDPFDRMIVAHAINHGLTVVTHDRLFERYPAGILWA
jgi:PIN domain nuclease of toxin-antitoxin system